MNHWTIGKKLIASFLAVSAITLLLGLVGYYGAVKSNEANGRIGKVRLPSVQSLLTISAKAEAIRVAQRTLLNPDLTPVDRKRQPENVAKAIAAYAAAWNMYEPLPKTVEEAAAWKEFATAWEQWQKDSEKFFKLNGELETLAILNSVELQRDLQQFVGDHYKLTLAILNHVQNGEEGKGGEDPAACNFGQWMAKFETTNPELQRILDAMRPSHQAFHAGVKTARELAGKGDKIGGVNTIQGVMKDARQKTFEGFAALLAEAAKASALRGKLTEQGMVVCLASQRKAIALLDKLVEINTTVVSDTTKTSSAQATTLKILSLVAMVVGVAVALALGILISRSINKTLTGISTTLADGANQVAAAAGQVSGSSQSLAEGASEQAASLEETSSSLEEMTSMTKRNADNAANAKETAVQTRQSADAGAEQMKTMVAAMDSIKTASEDITKILKTIDEIAFQTNILALNAAVEAARAGEAGAGFAVVADEVRNLAQRCATAAKETAEKIEDSVKKSQQGAQISGDVAKSFGEIQTKVRQLDQLVAEIASASQKQSQGITQVNIAVTEMDKVTQSAAANAEECASASEELNAQAETLKDAVVELQKLVGGAANSQNTGPAAASTARTRRGNFTSARKPTRATPGGNGANHRDNGGTVLAATNPSRKTSEIPMEGDFKNF